MQANCFDILTLSLQSENDLRAQSENDLRTESENLLLLCFIVDFCENKINKKVKYDKSSNYVHHNIILLLL